MDDYKVILGLYTEDFTREDAAIQAKELKVRKAVLATKKGKRKKIINIFRETLKI